MSAIEITNDMTIEQVQKQFQERFPFLKIEFYSTEHAAGEGTPEALRVNVETTIGKARTIQSDGVLSIHGNQKVITLENAFHVLFGLNVQVFRRSGGLWLQTTTTDDWKLGEQNERAKDFSLG